MSAPTLVRPRVRAEVTDFVALGDSITVGLGDGLSMGSRGARGGATGDRGWAALLAPHLGPQGLTNLATTGARVRDVLADQLPTALAARPRVAGLVIGINDAIRPDFDAQRVADDLTSCVHQLRAVGSFVLLARLHDPGVLLLMPPSFRQRLVTRIAVLNAVVSSLAVDDPGVLVLDLPAHPECYAPSSWDVDRCHPSRRGHLLLAHGFADLLRERGVAVAPLPELGPAPGGPHAIRHGIWVLTRGLPWLVLRGGSVLHQVATA